jgi:carbon-monoxide dehydrogenase large subunit
MTRVEDNRLLTGRGRFVEDIRDGRAAHAVVFRSPVAHARILNLDVSRATAAPGVLAVLTGADLERFGCRPMGCRSFDGSDGAPFRSPTRHLLAKETARFVGDPIAFVVAETEAAALDAVEEIDVDFEELPVVTDPLRSDETAVLWEEGDAAAVERAFAGAAHVVAIDQRHDRVSVAPLEVRSALGRYEDGAYTLTTQTQGVHFMRAMVADSLGLDPTALRVVTEDVGGSFGIKLAHYPEQSLVLLAAKAAGRPVRWVESRSEAFLSDAQGRGQVSHAQVALDADGKILGLRVDTVGDLGAYTSSVGLSVLTKGFIKTLGHVYHVPALHCRTRAVYTNRAPTDAYRGAGKPEAQYLVERLLDKAARAAGVDRADLRRCNLIPAAAMPYTAANGFTYDSAHFEAVLDIALEASDWAGFPARRAAAEAKGLKRGIGLGVYLHLTGGTPKERSRVVLRHDGAIEVLTGVQASGQGHETAFARLVADRLEIDPSLVSVVEGDTARIATGGGTGGSSSLPIAGVTIVKATDAMLDRARDLAADRLEAAPADLTYGDGAFTVVGTDRRVGLFELVADGPEDTAPERICAGEADSDHETQTVPHGAYVAEVEVDPETGHVALVSFVGADDLGRRLVPSIAEGQLHGGLAQAIGQALFERVVYDDTGQLLTGSFMDYQLPRAGDLPWFDLRAADIATDINPLGMKGVGENASIGAIAPVMNAVSDALDAPDMDMPATPEKVWRALNPDAA